MSANEWDAISTPVSKEVDWDSVSQAVMPDETAAETARLRRTGTTLANQYRVGDRSAPAGMVEELAGGAKHAWDRAAMGLKGLVTDLSPADRMLLEQGKSFVADTGPASTVGQIGADVLMGAAPVTRLAKWGSALPKALGMSRVAAPVAADIGANAAYSAATAPEDRGEAAMYGAAGAGVGRVANRLLSGAVKPTAQAQELMDAGVRLTPGQAGGGRGVGALARVYEQGLEAIPGAGNLVSRARQTGVEDWNRQLTRQLDPTVLPAGIDQGAAVGSKGLSQARNDVSTLYKRAFPQGTVLTLSGENLERYDEVVKGLAAKVAPSARGKFHEVADWTKQNLKEGVDADQWKEVIEGEIDGAIAAARRDGATSLAKSLSGLDSQLKRVLESIGGPTASVVKGLDQRYATLSALEKAAGKAAPTQRGGVLYPTDVVTAASKGRAPVLLKQALEAQQLLGRSPNAMDKLGNMAKAGAVGVAGHTVVGGLMVPAVAMSLLGTTEMGRKLILGQATWQQFLAKHPDFASQVLRAHQTQKSQQR